MAASIGLCAYERGPGLERPVSLQHEESKVDADRPRPLSRQGYGPGAALPATMRLGITSSSIMSIETRLEHERIFGAEELVPGRPTGHRRRGTRRAESWSRNGEDVVGRVGIEPTTP